MSPTEPRTSGDPRSAPVSGVAGAPSSGYDTEAILVELRDMIEQAGTLPLSSSPRVNRDEVLQLLDEAIEAFPEELREARWLLKEREEFLAKAHREAEQIIEAARVRAERMVERTEVVREARRTAEAVVTDANDKARALQHEAEDYVDQKLAAFEVVLERTMQTVQRGRDRLQVHVGAPRMAEPIDDDLDEAEAQFFDQDDSTP